MYSEDNIKELFYTFEKNTANFRSIVVELLKTRDTYQSVEAQEYLAHGVCRRLKILLLSVENIFSLFPPTQNKPLDSETLSNVQINLHAFFININGLIDNLAWCYVHEHNLKSRKKFNKFDVGLFKKKTQNILGPCMKSLVQSKPINDWYESYSKDFRDALAHRIPMYIPPSVLSSDEAKEYHAINVSANYSAY